VVCLAPRAREDSVRPRRLSDVVVRPLNFTVRGRALVRWLSRVGTAILVLAVSVVVAAFTLSLFPRTLTGVLLLVLVGVPVALLLEGLADIVFSEQSDRWYHPLALLGFIALLVGLWWWLGTHVSFVRRHFAG